MPANTVCYDVAADGNEFLFRLAWNERLSLRIREPTVVVGSISLGIPVIWPGGLCGFMWLVQGPSSRLILANVAARMRGNVSSYERSVSWQCQLTRM